MSEIRITCSAKDLDKGMIGKYLDIMRQKSPNDSDFQKLFNGFYMVRRGEDWRKKYYQIFGEVLKEQNNSFEKLLTKVYEKTGQMEFSFTSKMLHTLDPEKPIWDKNVLQELNISKVPYSKDFTTRLKLAIKTFSELENTYQEYFATEDCKKQIRIFDEEFPEAKEISKMKKIDFLLWKQNAINRNPQQKNN